MRAPDDSPPTSRGTNSSGVSIEEIKETALAVVTDPVSFYRSMPRGGGLVSPLLFLVAMAILTTLVGGMVTFLFGGNGPSGTGALLILVLLPVLVAIYYFISAGVMYVIWRLMGSQEDYETAFRCLAFASAIMPVTALLGPIPYLGVVVPTLWGLYLVVTASQHVHGLDPKTAWIVFGAISGVLMLMQLGSEVAGRRMGEDMQKLEQRMEGVETMSPEDAGRAIGDFLKGMQDGLGETGTDGK